MTFLTPEPTTDPAEAEEAPPPEAPAEAAAPAGADAEGEAEDRDEGADEASEQGRDAAEAPAEAAAPAGADAEGEAEDRDEGADEASEQGRDAAEAPAEAAAPAGADAEGEAEDRDEGADEASEQNEDASISPYDRPGKWYVVHTQSGYEKKVKKNLEARIASMNMEDRIFAVEIPMEDVVEFKNGKKQVVPKKMFPGYLLTRAKLDDDSWYVIRNTPGITGFVGQGAKPSPLRRRDVENFLGTKEESATKDVSKVKVRSQWELSETVRVKEGPFADFSGEIIEINDDQLKVKVLVNIFGRETPVELEFGQVAKL